jgi:tetratricopeptide (TPR) repeat protein
MTIPIQIREGTAGLEPPAGWFVTGSDTGQWLEVVVALGLATPGTRVFVVPGGVDGGRVAGLLVVGPAVGVVGRVAGALPCRCLAGRLYLPAEGRLFPPVTDAEVRELCRLEVGFLHPGGVLSGFDAAEALGVADLLEVPEERLENWNGARAGEPPLPGLLGVRLVTPPDLGGMLQDAASEIGSEPPKALPPSPGEPRDSAVGKGLRGAQAALAKGVAKAVSMLPSSASQRTWANDLQDWALRQLRQVSDDLEQLRNKELHRLMHLLESDPEQGLRHAIPLKSSDHRGMAEPGAKLGERSPEFDPSRLGGGPGDGWEVPESLRLALQMRYREMANRELRLGRFRRAAYIYGELLGDYVGAAAALRQGKDFRSAALVLENYLSNPLMAAECLAEGGLLAEAAERYERLGRWLEAAELHAKLGNEATARGALEQAVTQCRTRGDLPGAARIIEERLGDPDRALKLLLEAWPERLEALAALEAAFEMMGRLGRAAEAMAWLRTNRGSLLGTSGRRNAVASWLAQVGVRFPDADVRAHAADLVRQLVAQALGGAGLSAEDLRHLTGLLVTLAPTDRLLSRDVNRYREQHRGQRRALVSRLASVLPAAAVAQIVRRFEMPDRGGWIGMRECGDTLLAVSVGSGEIRLDVLLEEQHLTTARWTVEPDVLRRHGVLWEPLDAEGFRVALALGSEPLSELKLPVSDGRRKIQVVAGTPSWLPAGTLALAAGDEATWTCHVSEERVILNSWLLSGALLRTEDLSAALLEGTQMDEGSRVRMAAVGNTLVAAFGNRLIVGADASGRVSLDVPATIIGLVPTRRHLRRGVVVLMTTGAVLHWFGTPGFIELDTDMAEPMAAFVAGGPLVLLSGNEAVLLDVEGSGVRHVGRMRIEGTEAVGVVGLPRTGEFAVLLRAGQVLVYRVGNGAAGGS